MNKFLNSSTFFSIFLTISFSNVILGQTNNESLGNQAGSSITNGDNNVLIGDNAGEELTTGSNNTFLGRNAGLNQKTVSDNVFVGKDSGKNNNSGGGLTFVGTESGKSNTTGDGNTFVGYKSGFSNLSSGKNTFLGTSTGYSNIAEYNTFVGSGAGYFNTSGEHNVYIGFQSSWLTSIDSNNTAIGSQSDIVGSNSVCIGFTSKVFGSNNVSIGHLADVSSSNSISIGASSQVTGSNSIGIGYGTKVTAANSVYIGNTSMTSISGIVNWTATSDGRFKTNVKENIKGLDFINKLRPVSYNYKTEKIEKFYGKEIPESLKNSSREKDEIRYSGFIAQEVEKIAKELNFDFSGVDAPQDKDSQIYGIRYAEFVVPLVKAVQELSKTVESQNEEISNLKLQQKIILAQNELIKELERKLIKLEEDSKDSITPLYKLISKN
ncbi:MAG: hypothetical protein DWQ06_03535 [Calditrichaeota bacterium]|nr:MAG: hypothetical protein DWQ06_03535 [Calditrichota bacterium]